MGEFSERNGLASRGGRPAGCVPAAYVCYLGQQLLIGTGFLHPVTIEQTFDLYR